MQVAQQIQRQEQPPCQTNHKQRARVMPEGGEAGQGGGDAAGEVAEVPEEEGEGDEGAGGENASWLRRV